MPTSCWLTLGCRNLDGYGVARRLRARLGHHVELVALTGYGQETDRRPSVPAARPAWKPSGAATLGGLEQGKKVAQVNGASCHGNTGKGNGPAAMAVSPKPADWTSKKVQDETDGETFWKITTRRGAMPLWKHLPENDRWALVQHIRSLRK